jgi:hypothetical protein
MGDSDLTRSSTFDPERASFSAPACLMHPLENRRCNGRTASRSQQSTPAIRSLIAGNISLLSQSCQQHEGDNERNH